MEVRADEKETLSLFASVRAVVVREIVTLPSVRAQTIGKKLNRLDFNRGGSIGGRCHNNVPPCPENMCLPNYFSYACFLTPIELLSLVK